MSVTRTVVLGLALAACGGSSGDSTPTGPPAPPLGPAKVALSNGSVATTGVADVVTVTTANSGGAGIYYLEFWGYPILPTCVSNGPGNPGGTCPNSGMQSLGDAQPVSITAGYSETVSYSVASSIVASVKVFTQPTNTATYAETDCAKVRPYGVCP